MKVFKYVLEVTDEQVIEIPQFLEVLSAQLQDGKICLWVLCNENGETDKHKIVIVGTGNPIQNRLGDFIDTVQLPSGLVFHVFFEA